MKKIYCINVQNPKISQIFDKTLVLSVIYDTWGKNDEKYLNILKILGLVNNMNE